MTFREDFVSRFGEYNARAIEKVANEHKNGVNSRNKGSDLFRWAILICIGHECISRFAGYHDIQCKWEDVCVWLKTHKTHINEHDGDLDYILRLSVARINEFVEKSDAPTNP